MQQTQEMQVQALGLEELLEKEKATHSSILAWKRIPPMDRGALVGYRSKGCKELHSTEWLNTQTTRELPKS